MTDDEKKLIRLQSANESAANVIVGYQRKFVKLEKENERYRNSLSLIINHFDQFCDQPCYAAKNMALAALTD